MNKLLEWAKKHITFKDFIYWIVIAWIIGLLCTSIKTCNRNSSMYENNIKSLTEQVEFYQSENGALVATKTAFESNIKELKLANKDLYDELSDLKVKLKNITAAANFSGEIDFGKQDTVYVLQKDESGVLQNFTQRFDFSNQWRLLSGNLAFQNDSIGLTIDNDKVLFDYTIAIDKDNKIHVKSNNPYVTYNDLSGFVIPKPKKTTFSIGPTVGIGYGMFNKSSDLFIGISATWKLFEF